MNLLQKVKEEAQEIANATNERKKLLSERRSGYIVYWHHLETHTDPHSEGYIGLTSPSKYGDRFNGGLIKNYKKCTCFLNAINEYGENKILTSILKDGLSLCNGNELEFKFRPLANIGWNINQGGGSNGALSESTKEKISKSKKGKNHLYYDKIFTPESKEKIRQSKLGNKNMVGKKLSKETKIKMSIANKGVSEKTRKAVLKQVICIETGIVYQSQVEAQKLTGISRKGISECCLGNRIKTRGFQWEFYKEVTREK